MKRYSPRLRIQPYVVLSVFCVCMGRSLDTNLGTSAVFADSAERPNVVFITVDDMNCDSVGTYGSPVPNSTPHIDALAASGMRFEHAHVTIAICQPTRAVWMTGRYPHRSGALGFDPIHPHVPTLVEALKASGYFTGILGKTTHVVPTRAHAWDVSVRMEELGFGRDPSKYEESSLSVIQNAIAADQPFFLMANAHDPHRPFESSNRSEMRRAKFAFPSMEMLSASKNLVPGFLPDLPNVREELAQYYMSVRRADQVVGSVLNAIDRAHQTANTIVVFMSDHGMPLPFAKTNCWRHSTRTPWVVRWPGVVSAGSIDDQHVISGVDLAPTVLDAVGLPNLDGADGRTIVPILRGGQQDDREFAITHINRTSGKNEYPMRSVIGKRFGYIYNGWPDGQKVFKNESQAGLTMKAMRQAAVSDEELQNRVDHFVYRCAEEFYDYQADPDARTNLIDDVRHASRIERMRGELLEHMKETGDPQLKSFWTFQAEWQVEQQNSGTTVSLRGLHVRNKQLAWASGQAGTILRTSDGGESWYEMKVPESMSLDFRGVHGFDANSGVAISAGTPARIVTTDNGGKTWQTRYESNDERVFFDAIAFWDDQRGLAFSDPIDGRLLILTTDDRGVTWRQVPDENVPPALAGEAGFAASNSCLAVNGSSHAWIGLGGETNHGKARIFYSVDNGRNWRVSDTPISSGRSSGVFSISFRDSTYGVAVGGNYELVEQGGRKVAAVTRDGGETWHAIVGPGPSGFRSAVTHSVLNGRSFFIASGPNGTDISCDGGQSWRRMKRRSEGGAFHSISFSPDSSIGFGVGQNGKIGRISPASDTFR